MVKKNAFFDETHYIESIMVTDRSVNQVLTRCTEFITDIWFADYQGVKCAIVEKKDGTVVIVPWKEVKRVVLKPKEI